MLCARAPPWQHSVPARVNIEQILIGTHWVPVCGQGKEPDLPGHALASPAPAWFLGLLALQRPLMPGKSAWILSGHWGAKEGLGQAALRSDFRGQHTALLVGEAEIVKSEA